MFEHTKSERVTAYVHSTDGLYTLHTLPVGYLSAVRTFAVPSAYLVNTVPQFKLFMKDDHLQTTCAPSIC